MTKNQARVAPSKSYPRSHSQPGRRLPLAPSSSTSRRHLETQRGELQQRYTTLTKRISAFADMRRLQYLTDTLDGSSGSPVFDVNWCVVGLHHKGGVVVETPGAKQAFYRNQGIHINAVIDGLTNHRLF
jgi:hypothetical protein